jgi:hypothetical protein
VRQLETDSERARQSFEKRLRAESEAKESAFRDASEAHRLQFYVSVLLRVVGPVALLNGLLLVSQAKGNTAVTILAAVLLVVALGLSAWALVLGKRLKRHVDGLFEFLFREKLRSARSGEGSTSGDSSVEIRVNGSAATTPPSTAAGTRTSRRFGKSAVRGAKDGSARAKAKTAVSLGGDGAEAAGAAATAPAPAAGATAAGSAGSGAEPAPSATAGPAGPGSGPGAGDSPAPGSAPSGPADAPAGVAAPAAAGTPAAGPAPAAGASASPGTDAASGQAAGTAATRTPQDAGPAGAAAPAAPTPDRK